MGRLTKCSIYFLCGVQPKYRKLRASTVKKVWEYGRSSYVMTSLPSVQDGLPYLELGVLRGDDIIVYM